MRFDEMGLRLLYAPDGALAGASDGSGEGQGVPDPAQSAGTSSVGGDTGTSSPAWMSQLPADLKGDPELANYSTIGDFIKAVKDGKVKGGARQGENTGKQQEPVEYKNFGKRFDEMDDPFGDMTNFMVDKLRAQGMKQGDAEKFFDDYANANKTAKERFIKEAKSWVAAVKQKDWGDKYTERANQMQRAMKVVGDTDGSLQAMLEKSGATVNPAFWEVMSRVGSLISEDTPAYSSQSGAAAPVSNPFAPIDFSKPNM